MKIFITGGTGFIGKNLVQRFDQHEVEVYKRQHGAIRSRLDDFSPDWIINCAAEIYNVAQMWSSNVELTRDCLEWVKDHPGTRMLHMGSSSEYGPVAQASREDDPIQATDMYAGTKGMATLLCQTYSRVHDLDVTVVRPYSPYGPGEKSHRLFPRLWQAFRLDRPMDLVQGVHDFCYIDDFVRAVEMIMNSEDRERGMIVNISGGIEYTNIQVLECFQRVTGKSAPVTLIDKFATPIKWQANVTLARERFGWCPEIDLEQGIRLFLEKAHYE